MKAARRAAFTFDVAARLRAPSAVHATGTATDASTATSANAVGTLTPGAAQELDGARVGELGGRGVVLGSVVLHEPVLRAGVDVGLAAIGSGLLFGLGVDELVVLGEMAEVG